MLKRFVPRNSSMNRFIVQFNKFLFDRIKEDRAEFHTTIVRNVRERAWPIEEHASTFYTAAAFSLFRKEVTKSTHYFARERITNKEYDVVHVKPHKKLPWGREKFTVVFNCNAGTYDCECGQYHHFGILCSHVIRVLVQIGVAEVPKGHIQKRWTKSATDVLPEGLKSYQKHTLCISMTYRHRYLLMRALGLVKDGDRDLGAFDIVAKCILKGEKKLREYFKNKNKTTATGGMNGFGKENRYYTTDSEAGVDSASEVEGVTNNSYGAAGSSSWMSDSELLKIKAPSYERRPGRPQGTRFKGVTDYYKSKQKKKKNITECTKRKNETSAELKQKKLMRCGECKLLGHSATQCKKKQVDLYSEMPEF